MQTTNIPQLLNIEGVMHIDAATLLIRFYSDGECDTIEANEPNEENLRAALYDERETGGLPADCTEVYLPNGRLFKL